MSTIVTRAGKGSPLTNAEVDSNFTNLNTDKAELSGATFTGDVTSTGFAGDITGAVLFQAKAGEGFTKGDPVYISGISGNTTVVSKADANDANKMPCFGIVDATVSINANCSIVTFGSLANLNTSAFSEGDELYISDTGTLSTTAPTSEASQLQKIAKVTRSHASAGSIKVMGAGRTNATPNLDEGKFFLGNSSNQSASATFSTSVTGIALPLSGGAMTGAITTTSTVDGRDVATDGSKLDGIEAGADVTDTANVTAAGALMDSELTSEASVKALNQGVATTDSPTFAGIDVTGTATMDGLTVDGGVTTSVNLGSIAAGSSSNVFINKGFDGAGKLDFASGGTLFSAFRINVDSLEAVSFDWNYDNAVGLDRDIKFTADGSRNLLNLNSNGDISFYEDTGTTPTFFWDASAESLGIGTSSPQALTHLYTESGINTADTLLKLTNVANTARYVGFQAQRDNASGQGLNILITKTDASVVNALTIDTAANVGIGTSSVDSLLHLSKASGGSIIRLENPDVALSDSEVVGRIEFETQDGGGAGVNSYIQAVGQGTGGANKLEFGTGTANSPATRMVIDSSGHVLLNRTASTGALTLESQAPSGFSIGSGFYSGSTQSTIEFKDSNTTANYKVRIGSQTDDMIMFAGGAEHMRINASGALVLSKGNPLYSESGRVTNFTTTSSYSNALNFSTLGATDASRGMYLVTVCRAGASVASHWIAIIGVSSSGYSYIYEVIRAANLNAQMSGSWLQLSSSTSWTVHITAVPIGITGND